jgi:hypothetical protein
LRHDAHDAAGRFVDRPRRDPERIQNRGALEAENLLKGLSVQQLHEGLRKGRDQLAMIDALDHMDREDIADNIGHPGRHASTSYQSWVERDSETRRLQLHVAIRDVQAELTRRGETF